MEIPMPTSNDFAKKVTKAFKKEITDQVFLFIQDNPELMKEWRYVVEKESLQQVNLLLGDVVKKEFKLNNGDRCSEPKSILIGSYTEHC